MQKFWVGWYAHFQLRSNKAHSASFFLSRTINKCLLCGLFSAMFLAFLCFLLTISVYSGPPSQCRSAASSTRQLRCDSTQKRRGSDELHSGVSHSAVGCASNVNESKIHIKYIKQGRVLIGWWKCCSQRRTGTYHHISPRSDGSVFANSRFTEALWMKWPRTPRVDNAEALEQRLV